jgi:hypothetical protein
MCLMGCDGLQDLAHAQQGEHSAHTLDCWQQAGGETAADSTEQH